MTCPLCGKAAQPQAVFCGGCDAFVGTPGVGKRAQLLTRALALLLDGLLASVVIAIGHVTRVFAQHQLSHWLSPAPSLVVGHAFGLVPLVFFALWVFQLFQRGETPGKKALGLTVISEATGAPAGPGIMVMRELLGHIVSALPLLAGYLGGFNSSTTRTWHDRFCGTVVVASSGALSVPVAMGVNVDDPEDILWEGGASSRANVETWRPTALGDQVAMIPTYRLDVGPTRGRSPFMRQLGYAAVACTLAVTGWGVYNIMPHGHPVTVLAAAPSAAPSPEGLTMPLTPATQVSETTAAPAADAGVTAPVSAVPAQAGASPEFAAAVDALGGPEPARTQAVNLLVSRAPDSVGSLVNALGNTSRQIRTGACEALGRIGKPAVPALLGALQSSEPRVRLRACKALALVGPAAGSALDALHEVERDTNENIRKAATEAIAAVGPGESKAPLMGITAGSGPSLANLGSALRPSTPGASLTLGAPVGPDAPNTTGPAPAAVRETADLESTDASVRLKAVKMLASSKMPPESKVAPLIRALDDSAAPVRRAAASALVAIGEPAVNGLTEALKDGSRNTRGWSAVALGKIGRRARSAVPTLVESLKDSDPQVRKACIAALASIQPRTSSSKASVDTASAETPAEAPSEAPPAPTADEPVAPNSGKLILSSNPSGAQIVGLTSGKSYGTTPCSLPGLKPGRWKFLVKADGYQTQQVEISVHAGETARSKVKLVSAETANAAGDSAGTSASPAPDKVPAGGEEDIE